MINRIALALVAGGLFAGLVTPQAARAHGSEELVAFVAGTAVGYLLNADRDVHHVYHHHGHPPPAYVVQHHHYAPPPVRVVHYHDRPRYHEPHRHKHYRKHHGRGRYRD